MITLIKTALILGAIFWVSLGLAAILWLMNTAAKMERRERERGD